MCLIIMTLQFPDCDDEDAVSVSCLDIYYTVKFKKTKVTKMIKLLHFCWIT